MSEDSIRNLTMFVGVMALRYQHHITSVTTPAYIVTVFRLVLIGELTRELAYHIFVEDGVCIPQSYTSWLAPIQCPKLHSEVRATRDKDKHPDVSAPCAM